MFISSILVASSFGSVSYGMGNDIFATIYDNGIARLRHLIDAGANVNQQDRRGQNSLHAAAYNGRKAAAQLLISNGVIIDQLNEKGKTPFDIAMQLNQRSFIIFIEPYIRRIQFAERRVREHIIPQALAMTTHERLGSDSPMALLPQDLLQHISRLTQHAELMDARQPQIVEQQGILRTVSSTATNLLSDYRAVAVAAAAAIILGAWFATIHHH